MIYYYDSEIIDMLTYGRLIGFKDELDLSSDQYHIQNHRGANDFPVQVDQYLAREVKEPGTLRPFDHSPFDK